MYLWSLDKCVFLQSLEDSSDLEMECKEIQQDRNEYSQTLSGNCEEVPKQNMLHL